MNNTDNKNCGKVWLVGAGPGDAGLFTMRGRQVIEQADVVVYDKLVGQGILAMIPEDTEKIFVGKVAGKHPVPQHEINKILLQEALKGKKVARLKGGDPFVFGRGGEELELLLENQVPFEIVPGITSAISVPAYNGIPVTHRDFVSSLHIITGHTKSKDEAEIDYQSLVKLGGTFVFLMGISAMPKICAGLMEAGMPKDMPAAVLERGTTAHQRRVVSTVESLTRDAEAAKIKTPAIIVVGKVCSLADKFHWAEDRPLGGLKIAITRPKDRSSSLADKLRFLGAEVMMVPAIKTVALEDQSQLKTELKDNLKAYSHIAFTSPAGVEIFFDVMKSIPMDIRKLGHIRFAAIGSATKAALEKRGLLVDVMPKVYSGEELGRLLKDEAGEYPDMKVLIPRAKIGTDDVIKPLAEAGISYLDVAIYDTLYEKTGTMDETHVNSFEYEEDEIDYVAFTSASTVRGFAENSGLSKEQLRTLKAVAIGEKTAEEARKYGMEVAVSKEATIDSLVQVFLEKAIDNKCK